MVADDHDVVVQVLASVRIAVGVKLALYPKFTNKSGRRSRFAIQGRIWQQRYRETTADRLATFEQDKRAHMVPVDGT